jgi:hypothetical protein
MVSIRPILLAALPFALFACGGDTGGTVVPEGTHYQYVSAKAFVPTNNSQAREYGLDLNGDKQPDNQLGMVLGTLATMGFDIQGTIDKAVAEGSIILLVDFQTKDFTNTTAAGLNVLLGANPQPAACNTGETYTCTTTAPITCTGCGRHLTGTGAFSIAAGSPTNEAVAGKIVNGTFDGGPGNISLQIALGGTTAIQLDLIGARAKASAITDTAIGSALLGGALTQEDLNSKVIPAIATQIAPIITRDCTNTTPPGCGCAAGSTGKTVLDLFDGDIPGSTKDCKVSVEEIQGNDLIQSLLAPDVTIDGKMALSLGIKVQAAHATFTAP